jgi:4-amino-4-deoxy-L-arabinose transferase-like glycosyltransferase
MTSVPTAPSRAARRPGLVRWGLPALLAALFFVRLGALPLLEPDEGRYTEIPREMLASADLATPRLDGVLYFEKPPLYYWLTASAEAVLGPSELAGRLWSALLGLLGALVAGRLAATMVREGRNGGGDLDAAPAAGRIATVALATSPLYLGLARLAIIDMTVSFFVTLTLACFWWLRGAGSDRRARRFGYAMFAAAAMAALAKGLIAIVIPGAVVLIFLVATGGWRVLGRVPWVGGIALFLAIAAPWHVWMALHHPRFLWFYFVHEHFLRFATDATHRWEPAWFFVPVVLGGFLPWAGLLPAIARRISRRRPEVVFLVVWAAFVFLFFSASHSKLIPYVLPCLPPLAVLAGLELGGADGRPPGRLAGWGLAAGSLAVAGLAALLAAIGSGHWPELAGGRVPAGSPTLGWALAGGSCLAALAAAAIGFRDRPRRAFAPAAVAAGLLFFALAAIAERLPGERTTRDLAARLAARLEPGDEVASYRDYPQSLPPYLGRVIDVVDYRGELDFGISQLPEAERLRRFPTAEEFRERWRSPGRIFLVTEERDLPRMREAGMDPGPVLDRQGRRVLLSNRLPVHGTGGARPAEAGP